MRERYLALLPSVLALSLATLLALPAAAAAEPASISMYPETAGPGATIEVTGAGFPGDRPVELQLVTPDGTVPLLSTVSSADGGFRHIVALPPDAHDGAWELLAVAGGGTSARLAFVTEAAALAGDATAVAALDTAEEAPAGNSGADIMVMLVIAVVLGGLAFGAMVAYRQLRDPSPTSMGKGADLIWGGGLSDGAPEMTATDEPHWKRPESSQPTQSAPGEG